MTEIALFILDRIQEERKRGPARLWYETLRIYEGIVQYHQQWPVMVDGPATFEKVADASNPDFIRLHMTKQLMFLTELEFKKRFGVDPPTAPILKMIAMHWCTHPDYNNEWEYMP